MSDVHRAPCAKHASADAECSLLNGGSLKLYAGATLIAQPRFQTPALKAPVGGALEAHDLIPDEKAQATGRPDRFVAAQKNGTPVWSGSEGGAESALPLEPRLIQKNARVWVKFVRYET